MINLIPSLKRILKRPILLILLLGILPNLLYGQPYSTDHLSESEQDIYNKIVQTVCSPDSDMDEIIIALDELYMTSDSVDFQLGKGLTTYKKSVAFLLSGRIDKALKQIEESNYIFTNSKDTFWLVQVKVLEGDLHLRKGNFTIAKEIFLNVEELLKTSAQEKFILMTYDNLALLYQDESDIIKALDYHKRSLERKQMLKDQYHIATTYVNMAILYNSFCDYEMAIDYNLKANDIYIALGNKADEGQVMHNLGAIYLEQKKLLKAQEITEEALSISKDLGNTTNIAYAHNTLGLIFLEKNELDSAKLNFKISRKLATELGAGQLLASSNLNLGNSYFKQKRYSRAKSLLKKSSKWATKNKDYSTQEESDALLAKIYSINKEYEKAYYYERASRVAADSLPNAELIGKIHQTEIKHLEAQKELEVQILQQNKDIQSIAMAQQKKQLLLLFILTSIGAVIGIILIALVRKIKKQNQQLDKLNSDLNQASLRQIETIQSLENFAAIAAHDLKGPLRNVSSFMELLSKKNTAVWDDKESKYFGFISSSLKQLFQMIDDLLSLSKLDQQLPPIEEVDLQKVVEEIKIRLKEKIESSGTQIESKGPFPKVAAHSTLTTQLFQNIVDNGIKHHRGAVHPNIQIHYHPSLDNNEFAKFEIRDNGNGINHSEPSQIFELFHGNKKKNSTGIGLATCKKIVTNYGGQIWVESEKEKGTSIFFTLPLSGQGVTRRNQKVEGWVVS